MSPRTLLALALVALTSCAEMRARREAAAAQQRRLDERALPVPLDEAWPAALRLLAERGYPLVGADRAVGRQPPSGTLTDLLSPGFATRPLSEGARAAATGWADRPPPRVRYQIAGGPAAGGSRVRFVRITMENPSDPAQVRETRDAEMELELWRVLDAKGAEWIETGVAPLPTATPTATATATATVTPTPSATPTPTATPGG